MDKAQAKSSLSRKVAITGILGALTIALALTPVGMIPWFTGVALTICHVPVIIAAILEGPVAGMGVGAIFGLFSFIRAGVWPTGPGDLPFTNPLISVLPRILIGLVAWLAFRAFQGKKYEPVGYVVSGIAGALTNTVLVLGAFILFNIYPAEAVIPFAVSNGLPEVGAAAVLATAVVLAWKGIEGGRSRPKLEG